jgi:hypothetical protein
MKWDKHGLRLADVPNSGGVSQRRTGARGGNPRHDSRSGKFAPGASVKQQQNTPPPNTDPLAYKRMVDAARSAARQIGSIDEKTIAEFVKGRANAPEAVDIASFMAMVIEERKADLIDIIDSAMRGTDEGETVKVSAADDTLREHMNALGPADVAEVMSRLEGIGYDRSEVDAFFDSRIRVIEEAKNKRRALNTSDAWDFSPVAFIAADAHVKHEIAMPVISRDDLVEMMKSMPAPEVVVHVEQPKPITKKVIRNDKGLIESIEEVSE